MSVEKWERRKTARLYRRFYVIAVLVPLLAVGAVYLAVYLLGYKMESRDWVTVVFIVWIGTMVYLFWSGFRAAKQKMVYGEDSERE